MLVQVRPFSQSGLSVSSSLIVSNTGEGPGDINTPTSSMSVSGASHLHVSVPLSNIPNALVASLNFTPPTPLYQSARVASTSVPMIPTTILSNVVVTSVPNMHFTSSPLLQKV